MTELDQFIDFNKTKAVKTIETYKRMYKKISEILGGNVSHFSQEKIIQLVNDKVENINTTQALLNVALLIRKMLGMSTNILQAERKKNVEKVQKHTKEINEEIKYYTSSLHPCIDEQDTTLKKELFIKDTKYFIDGISPDRTEVLVEVDENIQNEEMREDFQTMGRTIEYKSIKTDEQGGIKFDQKNPYILEFEIDEEDRGFTQNMVGGELIIPNLYKLDGFEELDNDDAIVDEIDEPDWSPFPDDSPPPPDLPDEPFEELEVEVGDPLSPDGGARS